MRGSPTKTLQPPTILGHRGIREGGAIPENSIAAFLEAYKQGADGVELDVFLTKDDRLVVFHDDTLDRMTGTPGEIQDKTLEELQHLRLLNTTTGEKTEHEIPTLEKVLQALHKLRLDHQKDPRARDFKVNIEIKPMKANADGQRKNIAAPVAALIKRQVDADAWETKNFIVSSFDMETLRAIKTADADIHRRMLICSPDDIERDWRYDSKTNQISYRVQEKKDAAGNTRPAGKWESGRKPLLHDKFFGYDGERVWDITQEELCEHLKNHQQDVKPHSAALPISSMTPEAVREIEKIGAIAVAWTANERNPADYPKGFMTMLKERHIAEFITDFPRGMKDLIAQGPSHTPRVSLGR